CISQGIGYTPFSLIRGWNGGFTSQKSFGWFGVVPDPMADGESITEQLMVSVLPVLTPPLTEAPRASLALIVRSSPLKISDCPPNVSADTTRLLTELNFVGVMLYRPHS